MADQRKKMENKRTREVDQLLNTEPPWMIRWGTSLIFLMLVIGAAVVFLYLES